MTLMPPTEAGQVVQQLPQNVDRLSTKAARPRLSVRLGTADLDVERIAANWTAAGQAAANTATAIRLYDAILRGDLDAVRQIVPLLAPALIGSQMTAQRRSRPPLKESESFKNQDPEEKEGEPTDMIAALAEVTATDPGTNAAEFKRVADKLLGAAYTPDHVRAWYAAWWRTEDWRGRKGERPALRDVRELIGRVKALPPPAASPYDYPLPADDPDPEPPPQRPTVTSGPGYDPWLAALGQLQISLNHITFNQYVRPVRLIEIERSNDEYRYIASVPSPDLKAWLDLHLLPNWQRALSDIHRRAQRCTIQIEVEP